ncbi:hypothetical protein RRG08_031832 [Elysia crispata]|uniref:Uncharacterized protein n=1 Tax=Elysia crispata TaxID=231223 RepID=A0AAE0Y5S7_9GAST|nr:hypothetical protein RRG08_031832 [Elysia crispata]
MLDCLLSPRQSLKVRGNVPTFQTTTIFPKNISSWMRWLSQALLLAASPRCVRYKLQTKGRVMQSCLSRAARVIGRKEGNCG